jgi:glycerophosphoryl diester phosphodiesterase
MIVAHRGASEDAPENTLEAFRLAWLQNADAIEGDFRLTKDEQIVCIHDEDTSRTCGEKLIVAESTYAELSHLDASSHFKGDFAPQSIPLLSEVFKAIPSNKGIYIEIKCGPEIVPTLINWILDSDLRKEQVSIIAFDNQVIKAFKSIAPHIKAQWLYDVNDPVSIHELLDSLRDIKADGLGSNNTNSKELVNSITKAGFEYHSWTIDDNQIAEQLLKWGAASITTNKPGYLRQQLSIKYTS